MSSMLSSGMDRPPGNTRNCMVCGAGLQYLTRPAPVVCTYCRKEENGYFSCPAGHYVCDKCHNRPAIEAVRAAALGYRGTDPVHLAEALVGHPSVPMLGCQHAFIFVGAFLSAVRNEGTLNAGEPGMDEAFARTERQALGGYCGLTGVCGIVPAVGASLAVLLGSKCGTDAEQRAVMNTVSRTAEAIAGLTGPSCCKAYLRAALAVSAKCLEETTGVRLALSSPGACGFSAIHPHGCRKGLCPWYSPHSDDTGRNPAPEAPC